MTFKDISLTVKDHRSPVGTRRVLHPMTGRFEWVSGMGGMGGVGVAWRGVVWCGVVVCRSVFTTFYDRGA